MIIRVAYFPDSGYEKTIAPIQKILNNATSEKWRIDVAEYLDKLPCNVNKKTILKHYNEKKQIYLKDSYNPNVVFILNTNGSYSQINIESVDTSKCWKIDEYDGAESIEYFKKPIIIDKELNLCEW